MTNEEGGKRPLVVAVSQLSLKDQCVCQAECWPLPCSRLQAGKVSWAVPMFHSGDAHLAPLEIP